ncbi:MAG: hypothetical protein ACH350_08800, partial [Parachlamydiaceae bacterium]
LHVLAKTAIFGIFFVKFFDRMHAYALNIFKTICSKRAIFSSKASFRRSLIYQWRRFALSKFSL